MVCQLNMWFCCDEHDLIATFSSSEKVRAARCSLNADKLDIQEATVLATPYQCVHPLSPWSLINNLCLHCYSNSWHAHMSCHKQVADSAANNCQKQ